MIKCQKQSIGLLLVAMALLALAVPAAAWATNRKPAVCEDHTPHKIRMVKVAPGVELEVLDWGGKGKAMVLLTGAGDNAHVYDNFAFQFTDYFHVYGITRRGFLPSSQPRSGYDVPTRAADDIAVLDALGIDKAVFVGHSLANSELSELGLRHRARVDKLVYLDATDLSGSSKLRPPPGTSSLFTEAVFQSLWTYQAATARYFALREPDQSVCLNLTFGVNGAITGSTSQQFITDKLFARASANPPVNWAGIKAPRLGIFATYSLEARQPHYWYLSPADQAKFDEAWRPIVDFRRDVIDRFKAGNSANTFLLPGAPHYVYINNEAEVVRWMRKFLGIPPRA